MWIAAQHLYGIYHDFKKTIIPTAYHDSNYSEDQDSKNLSDPQSPDRIELLVKILKKNRILLKIMNAPPK